MGRRSSDSSWRPVLLVVIVSTALLFAGCVGSGDYTTTIGDPTTGEVIDNVSINEVTPITGVRLTVHHTADRVNISSYSLGVYVRENGTFEPLTYYSFDQHADSTGVTLDIPGRDETVVEQQIRVEHRENRTVVDAVDVTVSRVE